MPNNENATPEERHDAEGGEPKEGKRLLSPTQITTFMACPRKWYYEYVLRIKVPEKFALVRGTVVHKVCEAFFRWKPAPGWSFDELCHNMAETAQTMLKGFWAEEKVADRFGNDRYEETAAMIDRFVQLRKWKMESIYEKYKDSSKAWNFSKPKLCEEHFEDKELSVQGYIDAIIEMGPEEVVLIDYKTSSLYKHAVSEEHETQLYIYALLYERATGVRPLYVSVEYLLYGQVVNYPVRQQFLDEMRMLIRDIHSKTRSKDIADYPPNTEYKFCKWCDFREQCQGEKPVQ